jgi:hypothetical protein
MVNILGFFDVAVSFPAYFPVISDQENVILEFEKVDATHATAGRVAVAISLTDADRVTNCGFDP